MSEKLLVNVAEAAHMLSMGRSTFWRNVSAGVLPQPVRIGGLTRWRVADMVRMVNPGSETPCPSAAQACAQPE